MAFSRNTTVLDNSKITLGGAFQLLKYSKYASHYLAAVADRGNRRFGRRPLLERLVVDASQCGPITEKLA